MYKPGAALQPQTQPPRGGVLGGLPVQNTALPGGAPPAVDPNRQRLAQAMMGASMPGVAGKPMLDGPARSSPPPSPTGAIIQPTGGPGASYYAGNKKPPAPPPPPLPAPGGAMPNRPISPARPPRQPMRPPVMPGGRR